MKVNTNKQIWGMPLLLAGLTLFGLLAALLGTGIWYRAAWLAMIVPLSVMLRKIVLPKSQTGQDAITKKR